LILEITKKKVTIHHFARAEGIMIQNDGKQDVFQQLHGWIHACFESQSLGDAQAGLIVY
jgi:hypothetical protein